MTEMPQDYLERSKMLLAQAGRATNEAEALAFRSKAFKYAALHNVDRATLLASMSETKRAKEEPIVEAVLTFGRPFEQRMMLAFVAYNFFGNQAIKITRRKGENFLRLRVFGFASDMNAGQALHASLQLQCESACSVAQRTRPSSERLSSFKRAYWQRWYHEIAVRLERSQNRAVAESGTPGAAVAIRTRDDIVKAEMHARAGKPKKARKTKAARRSVSGDSAGRRDAQRADIGQARVGNVGQKEIAGS